MSTSTNPPSKSQSLVEEARRWPRDSFGEGRLFNELADEIERLRGALAQCNEHRDSPHKIIGIVDAALAGMPPYELAHESCGDEEPKVPGCHGYEP